ncbi:phosphotransferase [Paractinoplanes lichenicola]|uniref:Phosphotransferase n=1 Tax=Paractinoplanes lichenicola TaxID=2802976 RepID=A0ABS1VWM8_9ACTN|nr:phosphotransferase [Actinoplanes lichenicola]MBL7258892.1 phosphotransferase [Actinoplanes lichenicola]
MRPPDHVLRAFGVTGPVIPLAGGQGTSWRAGDLVLKPEPPVGSWLHDVVSAEFRLARPCGAHDGWSATRWLEGSETSDFVAVIEAGRAFHRATAGLPRQPSWAARTDRWAVADRIAWGEQPARWLPGFAPVAARLTAALQPLGPSQIVHCDLTRNVLLADGLPPAIIDVSPYWRPPAYAEGVVVADALTWHDAPGSLPRDAAVSVPAVARALLFRMATDTVTDWAWRYEHACRQINL